MDKEWVDNNQEFLKEYTIKQFPYMDLSNPSTDPHPPGNPNPGKWYIRLNSNPYEKTNYSYLPLHLPEYQFKFEFSSTRVAKALILNPNVTTNTESITLSITFIYDNKQYTTEKSTAFTWIYFDVIKIALRERNLNVLC
jgi:hypothetical protein